MHVEVSTVTNGTVPIVNALSYVKVHQHFLDAKLIAHDEVFFETCVCEQ